MIGSAVTRSTASAFERVRGSRGRSEQTLSMAALSSIARTITYLTRLNAWQQPRLQLSSSRSLESLVAWMIDVPKLEQSSLILSVPVHSFLRIIPLDRQSLLSLLVTPQICTVREKPKSI